MTQNPPPARRKRVRRIFPERRRTERTELDRRRGRGRRKDDKN